MDLGRFVVEEHLRTKRPIGELSRSYDIDPSWVYKRLKRYRLYGDAGLELRSRRPKSSPTRIADRYEDEIVALRKELLDLGADGGAATIQTFLERRHDEVPSISTIWRVLKARGFVTPQPHKRPKSSYTRFCADLPNECWQSDMTHWTLADGSVIEILNVIDDHSRLCVASKVFKTVRSADVVRTLHVAAGQWGYPASLLSDNGAIFTATHHGGEHAMEAELWSLGIGVKHGKPYHPQTQGKVERFHQTLKKYLAKQQPPATQKQLQGQLNRFMAFYNTVRPHRSIGRHTPIEAFNARAKATPHGPKIDVAGYRVLRNKVDSGGRITIKYRARQYHVGIGKRFSGLRVIVLVAGKKVKVLQQDGTILRNFTLDPTHDYQRQP